MCPIPRMYVSITFFFLEEGGGVGGSIDKIVFQKEGRVERHFFGNFTR